MARPKPFFIIGGYFKVFKLPSNRVGNSVKEHLIFAVNRVIATGKLSLKQIGKSSTFSVGKEKIEAWSICGNYVLDFETFHHH